MCKKCRDVIREKAITKQIELAKVESPHAFAMGVRFGELLAGLLLESQTRSLNDEIGPALAIMALLGGDASDKELTSLKTMEETYKHLVMEGAALTYGPVSAEARDKLNIIREIVGVPAMEIGKNGDEPKPGYNKPRTSDPIADLIDDLLKKATAKADSQPNASKQH